jgi:hypothetical protein
VLTKCIGFLTLQKVARVITTRLYEAQFIQCSLSLYLSNRSLSAEVALTEVSMGNMAVLSAILSVLFMAVTAELFR